MGSRKRPAWLSISMRQPWKSTLSRAILFVVMYRFAAALSSKLSSPLFGEFNEIGNPTRFFL